MSAALCTVLLLQAPPTNQHNTLCMYVSTSLSIGLKGQALFMTWETQIFPLNMNILFTRLPHVHTCACWHNYSCYHCGV